MKHKKKLVACSVAVIIGLVVANHSDEIRTSQAGLELIGNAEGCMRDPYQCSADVLTVGIGSTAYGGEPIIRNKRYTDEEIAERWVDDIKIAEKCVIDKFNGNKMNQGQFDAMTSLVFNVGCNGVITYFNRSLNRRVYTSIYKYAQAENFEAMCNRIPDFNKAGGRVLKGLVIRREKEKELCLSSIKG